MAVTFEDQDGVFTKEKTLGTVQLRSLNGEIILIPRPSSDPNDPLNWSTPFKYYVAILTCFGMLMCTFLAAGPAVAIIPQAQDFGSGPSTNLAVLLPAVAFFFTTSALTQGTGNLIWMPLITKYGRRPMYIISFTGYLITAIWAGATSGYKSELAARILLGFFSGAGECLGPTTITDVFFLHQRASAMAMYNFSTSSGVSLGIIISGAITLNNSWRSIYWVGASLIGALLILIVFTFPETAYNRVYTEDDAKGPIYENKAAPFRLSLSIILDDEKARIDRYYRENDEDSPSYEPESVSTIQRLEARIRRLEAAVLGRNKYDPLLSGNPTKKSYWSTLALFSGEIYTSETLWTMFIRPFGLILLPPVIWATLVMSVLIGFTVAISSSFANDLATAYGFTAFQSGLCFFGALIGGIIAMPAGGPVGEAVANYFTTRNGGIREPEFRLPAIAISIITAPLGLILYGYGLQNKLNFMIPVLGLSLVSFSGGQAINISFVYTLDAYSPVANEVTIAQLAFKSILGFGLSAGTNTWIAGSGIFLASTEWAIISGGTLLLAVPMFYYGKSLRKSSLKWRAIQFVRWAEDRE
ncbi:MFS general substrate transporter-7 [Coleophoma crateriformis]|uniref:MFS general substrate transporter-7 n=1 Tax=Coleophoma crateriformis TaxID=565419 RepID=A0A3D8S3B3_9HELO|nr:MFS general substrate transporter-7 [Coleophoma crateriformis]